MGKIVNLKAGHYNYDVAPTRFPLSCPFPEAIKGRYFFADGNGSPFDDPRGLRWSREGYLGDIYEVVLDEDALIFEKYLYRFTLKKPTNSTLQPGTYTWTLPGKFVSAYGPFATDNPQGRVHFQNKDVGPLNGSWNWNHQGPTGRWIVKVTIDKPVEVLPEFFGCFTLQTSTTLKPGVYHWTPPDSWGSCPFVNRDSRVAAVMFRNGDLHPWNQAAKNWVWVKLSNYEIVQFTLDEPAEVTAEATKYIDKVQTAVKRVTKVIWQTPLSDLPGIEAATAAAKVAAAVTPAPAFMAATLPAPKPAFVSGLGILATLGGKVWLPG